MDEEAENIYIHILNQTMLDNSIMISTTELSETYQIPIEEVSRIIEGLISGGYMIRLRDGIYSVRFTHLDEISVDEKIYQS